jgi:hypothetical protein
MICNCKKSKKTAGNNEGKPSEIKPHVSQVGLYFGGGNQQDDNNSESQVIKSLICPFCGRQTWEDI